MTLGPIKVEALRLARIAVKDQLKKEGMRISDFLSSDITKAALELIKMDDRYIAQATKNCKPLTK